MNPNSTSYHFIHTEDLVRKMASYPRRVKPRFGTADVLEFVADNGSTFSMEMDDLKKTASFYLPDDIPHQVAVFVRAVEEGSLEEWCEGLNYGKPDYVSSNE